MREWIWVHTQAPLWVVFIVSATAVVVAVALGCPPDGSDANFGMWSDPDTHGCKAHAWASNRQPDTEEEGGWAPDPQSGNYGMCADHRAQFVDPYYSHERWRYTFKCSVTDEDDPQRTVSSEPYESPWLDPPAYDSGVWRCLWAPQIGGWVPATVKTTARSEMKNAKPTSINWYVAVHNVHIDVVE